MNYRTNFFKEPTFSFTDALHGVPVSNPLIPALILIIPFLLLALSFDAQYVFVKL